MLPIFHVVHVCSVMLLFTAFGSVILSTTDRYHKISTILHGISLTLLLVTGFGMIGNPGDYPSKMWIAKIVILILLGGALTLAKRKILHPPLTLSIVLGLGFLAAYLGYMKPF